MNVGRKEVIIGKAQGLFTTLADLVCAQRERGKDQIGEG